MCYDRWDIVEAHYWFAVHYHGGQFSELYAKLCRISRYLKPSILADGPSSENACTIYNSLETKKRPQPYTLQSVRLWRG